jgi:DNA-directed RNA polymerase subunit RPC12/RpoP
MAKTITQALNQVATKSRCPDCGHVVESTFEEMKKQPRFACPCCGEKRDVREAVAWVEFHARRTWLKRVA